MIRVVISGEECNEDKVKLQQHVGLIVCKEKKSNFLMLNFCAATNFLQRYKSNYCPRRALRNARFTERSNVLRRVNPKKETTT